MMRRGPDTMIHALLVHNNLIEKAKWANFGYVVEQEGGGLCSEFGLHSSAAQKPMPASRHVCMSVSRPLRSSPGYHTRSF